MTPRPAAHLHRSDKPEPAVPRCLLAWQIIGFAAFFWGRKGFVRVDPPPPPPHAKQQWWCVGCPYRTRALSHYIKPQARAGHPSRGVHARCMPHLTFPLIAVAFFCR